MTTTIGIPRHTSIVRLAIIGIALIVISGLITAFGGESEANAAPCRSYSRSYDQRVTKYIAAEGWGLTAWRVRPTAWIVDQCTNGSVKVGPNLYDANVTAKGGKLTTSSVFYKTNSSTGWFTLGKLQSWPSEMFGFPYGVVLDGIRVTAIRVNTTVWGRAAGGGWVGLASSTNDFKIS